MSSSGGLPVAVLGATGYMGGRLAPRLLEAGCRVRAVVRSAYKLRSRPWGAHPNLEVVEADVLDRAALYRALEGCGAAYYLVHSMGPGARGDFADADLRAAKNMAAAAAGQGLDRIIYLGGLGEEGEGLSHHLRSRLETGRALQSGPTPVTWLKAAMILGAGSASFEILRYLVERLPIMITPAWVRTQCQPIAATNVLGYLLGCLANQATVGREFDIGGPEVLTYEDLFRLYARVAGLPPRLIVPTPLLTPRLSSWWIHLVTPVHASIARPLAEGLKNRVVCRENAIRELVPQELLTCEQAIRRALGRISRQDVETCWSDAGYAPPPEWLATGDAAYAGGDVLECNHRVVLDCPPERVWDVLRRIGGGTGWYHGQILWLLRGWLDLAVGGVGLGRGRRHPVEIRPGDALDFWRVLAVEENRMLLLSPEMRLPGEAVFLFQIDPQPGDRCELRQITRYFPRGLLGLLYWWVLYPVHRWLYSGMLRKIAARTGAAVLAGPENFTGSAPMCRLPDALSRKGRP